jgi:Raf kinase inhibitor-like YbhB/YbcL family protein
MLSANIRSLVIIRWLVWSISGLLLTAALLTGCGGEEPTPALAADEQDILSFEMTSAAFEPGGTIPQQHTCDGPDLSPPLRWAAPPEGTQSLVLIADDPDAPGKTWVHWVLYDLPPDRQELAEGLPQQETLIEGGVQGKNDFDKIGYGGPCPPKGKPHRYFFKLYALDIKLNLSPGATKSQVLERMSGHVLAEAELIGSYGR